MLVHFPAVYLLAACAPGAPDVPGFASEGKGWVGSNPQLGLDGRFDSDGARFSSGGADFSLGAAGAAWTPAPCDGDCARVEREDGSVTEWWENRVDRWEHGFDVTDGDNTLLLEVPIRGATARAFGAAVQILVPATAGFTYDRLVAFDAEGRPLDAHMEVVGHTIRLVVDTSGATWPVHVDPSLTPAIWIEAPDSNREFGFGAAIVGDTNGDGYDDALFSSGQSSSLYVFSGSAGGIPASPTGTLAYTDPAKVAAAGDINGDGYADAVAYEGTTLTVFYGSAAGLSGTGTSTILLYGPNNVVVTAVGDTNGDGYDDLVAGQPTWEDTQTNEGRIMLYRGSATGLATTESWTWDSDATNQGIGGAVTGGTSMGMATPTSPSAFGRIPTVSAPKAGRTCSSAAQPCPCCQASSSSPTSWTTRPGAVS